jgi:hypothetical protein
MENKTFKLETPKFTFGEVASMVAMGAVRAVAIAAVVIGAVVVLAVVDGTIQQKLDPEGFKKAWDEEQQAEN